MVYLVIFLLVAAAGLLRLWIQHRRERSRLRDVDGIMSSLEKLASQEPLGPVAHSHEMGAPGASSSSRSSAALARAASAEPRGAEPSSTALDPQSRRAARARIEARRARRARATG
jgi:hypothetical protein